jgi:acylphosphatase
MTGTRSVQVRIAGRVQGVSFRVWTERRANALGLSGWVRNLTSGDVEAVFSGPAEAVEAMLAACRNGPRLARVEKVEIVGEVEPASGPFSIRSRR